MDGTDQYIVTITDSRGDLNLIRMVLPKGLNPVSGLLTILQREFGPGYVRMREGGIYQWIPEEEEPDREPVGCGYAG